jgi:hypothetical protein
MTLAYVPQDLRMLYSYVDSSGKIGRVWGIGGSNYAQCFFLGHLTTIQKVLREKPPLLYGQSQFLQPENWINSGPRTTEFLYHADLIVELDPRIRLLKYRGHIEPIFMMAKTYGDIGRRVLTIDLTRA